MADRVGLTQSGENKRLECQTRKNRSVESKGFISGSSNPESVLDQPTRWTIFATMAATEKRQVRMSPREFADAIAKMFAQHKTGLPWTKLATFGDDADRESRCLRHNGNVRKIYGVEADYDGEELSLAWADAKLHDAGIAALIYESPSHRPDAPRWRVMCFTSKALALTERERLMARLNGVLDAEIDRSSFDLSRAFLFGGITGRPAPKVKLVDGMAIDLADHLDARALGRNGKPYRPRETAANDDHDISSELTSEEVERIRSALDAIPSDEIESYDPWREMGMALHHAFNGDPEGMALWDEASQWTATYDPDELEKRWDSFGRYGDQPVTLGSIFRLAKQHGWKDPRKTKSIAREFAGLRFYTPGDSAKVEPPEYVVKHLIARGDVSCIFGPPGAGKSLIGPHIGYQVALGEPAFGMLTKQGVVFYVAAEDESGLHQRVAGILARQGDTPNFRLVGGVSDLFSEDAPDLEALLEAVEDQGPALIVIDTLAVAFPGLEENDAKSMGRVITNCRQLAKHGAAVILVHHGTKADGSTPRGHSSLNGALEMTMRIERGDDGIVRATLGKNKRGTSDRDIAFRIDTEELGEDGDGEPIRAPVVSELTGSAATRPKKLPHAQREALAILQELSAEGRVSEEEWRDACIDGRRMSQSEERDSRKRVFNRVRAALFQASMIELRGGNVAEATSEEDDV